MAATVERITGCRALCISRGQLLLVWHETSEARDGYWILPGGGREAGENLPQAAMREVWEETGNRVRVVRRLPVPRRVRPGTSYALFLVATDEHRDAIPTVDLAAEVLLRRAAWFPVTTDAPLGPLDQSRWGYLAPVIRHLIKTVPTTT